MSDTGDTGRAGGWFAGVGRGSMNLKIAGIDEAVGQLKSLTSQIGTLTQQLTGLAQSQATLSGGLSKVITAVGQSAQQATSQVQQFNSATQSTVQNVKSGSGFINSLFAGASAAAGSDVLKDLAMFPLRYITQTVGSNRQLGMNISAGMGGQMFATGATPGVLAGQLARFPGNVLGSPEDLLQMMQVMRGSGAMLDLAATANSGDQGSARTVGMLRAIQQAQMITPGTPAGQIAATIGGFSSNVQAQQQGAFLTGGAFSMIAGGGKHKSLSEWADDITKWLESQRPGEKKGKPFDYGQLMAQYFPGSNIDQWFNVNGVPEGMKEYWWNYALAKARWVPTMAVGRAPGAVVAGQAAFTIEDASQQQTGNQAWERLQSVSSQARGQLKLASAMTGTYANKEQANRWFNDLLGQITSEVIPQQIAQGSLQALQYLPDAMEELLMGFLERSGPIGALIGGGLGYGLKGITSVSKNLMQMFTGGLAPGTISDTAMSGFLDIFQGGFRAGGGSTDILQNILAQVTGDGGDVPDPYTTRERKDLGKNDILAAARAILAPTRQDEPGTGDIGDMEFGGMGARSMAGLHPDMKRKVGRMMAANPRLRITSGMRDTFIQQNLKQKGHTRVSGKPSAHTRGQAADMGPRSEYPWLVANARKFGLSSGNNHGEPWHVGMGDIGDPTVTPAATTTTNDEGGQLRGLGALFNLLTGGEQSAATVTGAIGGLVPGIMQLFLGLFGMGEATAGQADALKFDPNVYELLRGEGAYTIGGLVGAPQETIRGWRYMSPWARRFFEQNNTDGTSDPSSLSSTGSQSLAGALTALGKDPAGMSPGVMVAHIAHFAGFPNSSIDEVVGLSKRESGWDPTAFNGDTIGTKDLSYGLMQINMLGNLGPARRAEYGISSNEELKDPLVNLKAAFKLSSGGTNFHHWGGYKGYDNFYNVDKVEATRITKEAGYGDVETPVMPMLTPMPEPSLYMPMDNGGTTRQLISFQNTFVIQGGGGGGGYPNGGMDVRRTVGLIADQLEGEMNKRLARRN